MGRDSRVAVDATLWGQNLPTMIVPSSCKSLPRYRILATLFQRNRTAPKGEAPETDISQPGKQGGAHTSTGKTIARISYISAFSALPLGKQCSPHTASSPQPLTTAGTCASHTQDLCMPGKTGQGSSTPPNSRCKK